MYKIKLSLPLLVSLVLSYFSFVSAQNSIEIIIKDAPEKYFYLKKIRGEEHILVDSSLCRNENVSFKNNYAPGMYFVQHEYSAFTFIINEPEIIFNTEWPSLEAKIKIIKSEENKLWFEYIRKRNLVYQKMEMLKSIRNWYDSESELFKIAAKEFDSLQQSLFYYIDLKTKAKLSHSFILADLKPKLVYRLTNESQKDFLIKHWFDFVDWNNSALINSDIINNKIRDFLTLFRKRDITRNELQEQYKTAMVNLIPLTFENIKMETYVIEFLVREFERYAMEEVLAFIAANYIYDAETCGMQSSTDETLTRLKKYAQLSIGKTAPNILMLDTNDEYVNLTDEMGSKNLILFWSSHCPHCTSLLPQINEWYKDSIDEGWKIFAVSLDQEENDLLEYLNETRLDYPVLCDYQGWESSAAVDYNIHATPSMLVLDDKRNIVSKPFNLYELEKLQ